MVSLVRAKARVSFAVLDPTINGGVRWLLGSQSDGFVLRAQPEGLRVPLVRTFSMHQVAPTGLSVVSLNGRRTCPPDVLLNGRRTWLPDVILNGMHAFLSAESQSEHCRGFFC